MKLQPANSKRIIDYPSKFKVGDFVRVACCFHGNYNESAGPGKVYYACNSGSNGLEKYVGKKLRLDDNSSLAAKVSLDGVPIGDRFFSGFFEPYEPKAPLTYKKALEILAKQGK